MNPTVPGIARIPCERLGILLCYVARHLISDQERCLAEFHRQFTEVFHPGNQSLFPNEAHVAIAAIEAKVRHHDLSFEVRHEEQAEDECVEVSEFSAIEARKNFRILP